MRHLINYVLLQISFFGTVLGHFSQYNFITFCCRATTVADIFPHNPHHEKASYVLVLLVMVNFLRDFYVFAKSKVRKIHRTVAFIQIMIIQMMALISKRRTNRKERKQRKATKTSFPKE